MQDTFQLLVLDSRRYTIRCWSLQVELSTPCFGFCVGLGLFLFLGFYWVVFSGFYLFCLLGFGVSKVWFVYKCFPCCFEWPRDALSRG